MIKRIAVQQPDNSFYAPIANDDSPGEVPATTHPQAGPCLFALHEELEFLVLFFRGKQFIAGLLGKRGEVFDRTGIGGDDGHRSGFRFLALAQGFFDLLRQQFVNTTVDELFDVGNFGVGAHGFSPDQDDR